jgi:hypothetical protein
MTKLFSSRLSLLAIASVSLTSTNMACQRANHLASDVKFVRTSPSTALLEQRDLSDKFLFGLNVIETKNFFSTALNLNFRPIETDLVLARDASGKPQLMVVTVAANGQRNKLLSFDVALKNNGQVEVNFNTAGNDLSLWNVIGGSTVDLEATDRTKAWKTAAAPKVVQVVQDPDSIIVDILHTVSFSTTATNDTASQQKTGQVKIRLFLKRQEKNPQITSRTASLARAENIGYFPSARMGANDAGQLPIAHYKINTRSKTPNQQIIYLKDFPPEYLPVGKEAIESWNISFGFQAFKTEVAGKDIDLGDPRYNVVKWIDGLDEEVPWAGYAPTMVNPRTGEVISTQILINGSTTRKGFAGIYKYTSEAAPQYPTLVGKIGNVPLVEGTGENPVVSFFADTHAKSEEEYIRGYYFGVIMHEFGHSLGLRHNFAGSTQIDSDGMTSSVMDYEPGFISNVRKIPGSYDRAAIRWGYFGERPQEQLAFCTDEDLEGRYDCNQGDVGQPEDFVVAGLIEGTTVLENLFVPLPDTVKKPMNKMIKNAFKIVGLANQLPVAKRATAVDAIQKAIERVKNARPAAGLTANERAIVEANLNKLAASYKDATTPKEKAPVALTLAP